jgi:hypothetical protein
MIISEPIFYLLILLTGAFLAGLVTGATGFAGGLILNAFWLHIMEPNSAIPLIITSCLLISAAPIYKLRKTLDFSKLRPFILSGVLGAPLGMLLLTLTEPYIFKASIGIFLVAYTLWMLTSNNFSIKVNENKSIDSLIGLISGLMGGFASLGGLLPTIWVSLQRLPKITQRGTYEPMIFITSLAAIVSFYIAGFFTMQIVYDFFKILPILMLGSWLGVKIFPLINEGLFQKIVLALILMSGIMLLIGPF